MKLVAATLALTHFQALTVFAFLTTLVFTFLSQKTTAERAKYFVRTFFLFIAVSLAMGWAMYAFPR